ncbi:MAG: hypothetical protein WBE26_08490 [Phycisphaerae bacterium]
MASAAPPPDQIDIEHHDPEGVVYLLMPLCDPFRVERIIRVPQSVGGVRLRRTCPRLLSFSLSGWGMLAMTLLVLTAGTLVLMRRRAVTAR